MNTKPLPHVFSDLFPPLVPLIRTGYGYSKEHLGVDYQGFVGQEIFAVHDGVVSALYQSVYGYGHYLVIKSENYKTLYAHCSVILVNLNQHVKGGEQIALVGATGSTKTPHLHLEMWYRDMSINPESVL